MLNLSSETSPWQKSELLTYGIGLERIKGLFRVEDYGKERIEERLDRDTKEKYGHDELFGLWCNVNDFIDVPVDFAWEYVRNVFSLEEWTYSLRNLRHIGSGIYKGHDILFAETEIFVRTESFTDARAVDFLCAWDQKEELWMRYYFRFIDAKPTLNRPGTILTWLNCRHPYYDRSFKNAPSWLKDAQNRKDRPWVGDYWHYFHAAHKIEAENLRYVLEHRYHNRK